MLVFNAIQTIIYMRIKVVISYVVKLMDNMMQAVVISSIVRVIILKL